ncbi:MAG: sterol desaturase family protein [Proteobacteria bacterium]|nr:sterol desaturase family protein [Pseudomonadota bacterium]
MKIILYAIPGFIILILFEWIYGLIRSRNTYRVADTITSISLGSISRLRGILVLGFGAWFYARVTDDYRLIDFPDTGVAIWLFAIVAYDFSYYWFHRASHEINLFWAAHVVHHQSEDYNLGTALRQSGSGLFGFIFYLPWLYLGIPLEIFLASAAINLVYQFWVHTEHVAKLGPLEAIFVTASNHRVHHAQNKIYIDRNYGGIFIIWDRLFGSFQEELATEPCVYGLRSALKSYNPFWANIHIYWYTLLDSWHAPHWLDKIKVWFKGPGWRPAGLENSRLKTATPLEDFQKYQPQISKPAKLYAFFQFFCTTLASTGLLLVAKSWDSEPLILTSGLLFFSFYLMGTWTDGSKLAPVLEWLKLALVFIIPAYLPLNGLVIILFQAYLLISAIALMYLSIYPYLPSNKQVIKQRQ